VKRATIIIVNAAATAITTTAVSDLNTATELNYASAAKRFKLIAVTSTA
jgi:hypothetical protein